MSGDLEPAAALKPKILVYNRVLLAGRLAIISFCMGIVVYYQAVYGQLGDYIPALAPVAATYLLTIFYAIFLERGAGQRRFAYLQLFIDQILISWIVYSTGGLNSPFTFMYTLVIVVSVFFGPVSATYALAWFAAILFGLMVGAEHYRVIFPYHPFPLLADPRELYYALMSVMANTLAFFFVAFMGSHISALLSRTGRELAQKIEDFTMLKAFHENVLRIMGLGFLAVGLDRSVLSVNPAAERILRVRAAGMIKKPAEQVLQLDEAREFFGRMDGDGEDERHFHWVYKAPDGDDVYLSMALTRFAVGGKTQGAVAVFQDVTELKMMERSMADSERLAAIGKVAAIIAHEIRNPLASLSGSIQILSSDLSPILDDQSARLMKIMTREADRLNNIITDFLDYSSAPALSRGEAGLAELIGEVLTLVKTSPKLSPAVEIETRAEEGLRAFIDQERIKQVLWNIILNALDSMPEGGKLSIEAARRTERPKAPRSMAARRGAESGPWIRISVEDTGEGMTKEVSDNIFEPFFTTKPGGTGLGLPSAKKIMESHGGSLEVFSSPGKGSRFILWLPTKPGA
jgi:two-component system sensor histidine kinase PilS (NtrC family)